MALPLYLAMTAAEMGGNTPLPEKFAYMACHFSPYGTGLSNLPHGLEPGAMLILNDRIPICGHDASRISGQLAEAVSNLGCESVLLDFQRSGVAETAYLSQSLIHSLPCPVGVSEAYADRLDCPVFLPPVPPDMPIGEYLAPWQGREIWLEAALDAAVVTVSDIGSRFTPLLYEEPPEDAHRDEALHCRYQISMEPTQACFKLYRTREELDALLSEAESLGVTRAVGLWQELGR